MKPRVVFHGHAAYDTEDGQCTIPKNTTFTLYAPLGAVIDESIATALANGEKINKDSLQATVDFAFLLNKDLKKPEVDIKDEIFPKTFKQDEKVPNFFLNPSDLKKVDAKASDQTPTKVVKVSKTTMLSDLLKEHAGNDLHWAACSFSRENIKEAKGLGYAYKFKKDSQLQKIYSPKKTQEEILAHRAKKFGSPIHSNQGAPIRHEREHKNRYSPY